MSRSFNIAIIGLDTSHSVELPKLMQDPATSAENKVSELHATRALRFPSAFQTEEGQDKRQAYLETIGVLVTTDFEEATADCDVLFLEINDPALHLEYFERCAKLGKPIFLDKPFADTLENAIKINQIAEENKIRYFTSSSLRFDIDFAEGLTKGVTPKAATIWGPIGHAAAGSSIIWYGCHTFEMLQAAMGYGAVCVTASESSSGYVFHVVYEDGRHGVIDMTWGSYRYGAVIRDNKKEELLIRVSGRIPYYQRLLEQIVAFLNGTQPVSIKDSFEVMAMLSAGALSAKTGRTEPVYRV